MVFCSQKTKKEKKKRVSNKWLLTDVGTDEQQADVWNNNTNPHQRTTQKWMNDMSIDQRYIDVQKC